MFFAGQGAFRVVSRRMSEAFQAERIPFSLWRRLHQDSCSVFRPRWVITSRVSTRSSVALSYMWPTVCAWRLETGRPAVSMKAPGYGISGAKSTSAVMNYELLCFMVASRASTRTPRKMKFLFQTSAAIVRTSALCLGMVSPQDWLRQDRNKPWRLHDRSPNCSNQDPQFCSLRGPGREALKR